MTVDQTEHLRARISDLEESIFNLLDLCSGRLKRARLAEAKNAVLWQILHDLLNTPPGNSPERCRAIAVAENLEDSKLIEAATRLLERLDKAEKERDELERQINQYLGLKRNDQRIRIK